MNSSFFLSLLQNIAILLSFSMLYEHLWVKQKHPGSLLNKFLSGFLIGGVGIVLMLTSWEMIPGIVFDTRSIILSISGLFFGSIPTLIAMIITSIYRWSLGGEGVFLGTAVIINSGIIGIIWSKIWERIGNQQRWLKLLSMGIVVHIAMMLSLLFLLKEKTWEAFSVTAWPVLTFYPFITMLLGLFMYRQLDNLKNKDALNSSRKRYSWLYESLNDAFAILDLDGNLKESNPAFQEMTGYSEAELLKMNFRDLTLEKWHKSEGHIIESLFVGKKSTVYEKECKRKNGTILPVEIRISLLKDEFGTPVLMSVMLSDISLQKNAIAQMKNEQTRLKDILETVPALVCLKNLNGEYVSCNQKFLGFIGVKEDELIGKSDFDFISEEEAEFYSQKDQEVIRNKKMVRFSNWIKSRENEKMILMETTKAPMYDSKGKLIGVLGIAQDISDIKKTEQDLVIAKEKAEESDKLKSIFLANMSHEIRTPMNAIMGFSELLTDSAISDTERLQYINIIQSSGNRLIQIIDDIVDISKLEQNQLTVNKSECDMFGLFSDTISAFQDETLLKSKSEVELILTYPKEHKGIVLVTDCDRFQQILKNLINNALKFTFKGTVEVGFGFEKAGAHTFLQVFVKDQGIGIPKDKQKLIFERFRQGDEDNFNEGAGLGLSICKGLAHLLGGKIWCESEEGKGSTFYFTVPFLVDKQKKISWETSGDNNAEMERKKILIAENGYNSLLDVKKLFEGENIDISHAENVGDIINLIDKIVPDLLILDLDIPGIDCIHYLNELKNKGLTTKVLAQTAHTLKEEEERLISEGVHGYIAKPFSKEQLLAEIKNVLS